MQTLSTAPTVAAAPHTTVHTSTTRLTPTTPRVPFAEVMKGAATASAELAMRTLPGGPAIALALRSGTMQMTPPVSAPSYAGAGRVGSVEDRVSRGVVGKRLLGQVACVLHAARARREDELGAEGLHGLRALDRQVLRHDQHHAVAADRRRHRQRDAGVAARGLDQRVAGADVATLLGAADHRQRRPVLDRTGRIVSLQFGKNDIGRVTRQMLQSD